MLTLPLSLANALLKLQPLVVVQTRICCYWHLAVAASDEMLLLLLPHILRGDCCVTRCKSLATFRFHLRVAELYAKA